MPSSDDEWRWKLRLFISTDLVGSTAYKASQHDSRWSSTFKEFFSDFPAAVHAGYETLCDKLVKPNNRLQTWKFSGDEILFWVELNASREVLTHLYVIKQAMREFPKKWQEKGVPLRLKATAWLAGFPVTNTEIVISVDGNGTEILDFIGPSIDLGFRIAKFCDVRRFAISADLAMMALDAVDALECEREHFHIHLNSLEVLKGVISNVPYPIFWIDMLDGEPVLEERLLGLHRDFRSDDIKDYLRKFIDKTETLQRPFIDNDSDPRYALINARLAELRDEMKAEESNRNYLINGETENPPVEEPRQVKPPSEKLKPGPSAELYHFG